MSDLDFLDGQEPAEAAVTPEPAAEAPASEGPARGPDGKFASAQAEPAPEAAPAEPEPAPQVAPPAAQPAVEPGHVPLSVVLEEREKRQRAEEQLRQYQAQQQQQEALPAPDPFEDPDAWREHQAAQLAATRWDAITSVSQMMASKEHGAQVVQDAAQAFTLEAAAKPWLWAELRQQQHPYEYVVQRQRREAALAKLDPSQVETFLAWQTAQAQVTPAAAPAAIPQSPTPPRSLAHLPNAGGGQPGAVPLDDKTVFGSVF